MTTEPITQKDTESDRLTGDDPGDQALHPEQGEMLFALVNGEQFSQLPKDLYIPPEALEVILEAFEGPLDLLLYLIKRRNLDILEINVAQITHQYMVYIEMMKAMHWELAAEYLLMAAMLTEIKSRMLLPRQVEDIEDEEDPRAELVRRLQEYERFKMAAVDIDELPRAGRDTFAALGEPPEHGVKRQEPAVSIQELLVALATMLKRAELLESHHITFEKLSTRERMSQMLEQLRKKRFVAFQDLFGINEGRNGVIVTFLALLELMKESLVEIVQGEPMGPIHIKARTI